MRDNIHATDLVETFWSLFQRPRVAEVFNIGGGRDVNCSMLEAIGLTEEITGRRLNWPYQETNRTGDHIWWLSDTRRFRSLYPEWRLTYDLRAIFQEIRGGLADRHPR